MKHSNSTNGSVGCLMSRVVPYFPQADISPPQQNCEAILAKKMEALGIPLQSSDHATNEEQNILTSSSQVQAPIAINAPSTASNPESEMVKWLQKIDSPAAAHSTLSHSNDSPKEELRGKRLGNARSDHPAQKLENQGDVIRWLEAACGEDILFDGNTMYVRSESHENIYVRLKKREPLAFFRQMLPEHERRNIRTHTLKEALFFFQDTPDYHCSGEDFNANPHAINLRNGVVLLGGDRPLLVPANSSGCLFTYAVDANFIDGTPPGLEGTAFLRFVRSSLGDDPEKLRFLLEAIGYSLSDCYDGKAMIALVGARDSGKSVMCSFLEELLPKELISNVAIHDFANRFSGDLIANAKLNVAHETELKPLKHVRFLKELTGGDRVMIEGKYRTAVSMQPRCHLIFAANGFPEILDDDPSSSLLSRFRVLLFPQPIPPEERNQRLREKLFDERDLIITHAIWATNDLFRRNCQFTVPADSAAFLNDMVGQNSLHKFLDEFVEFDPKGVVPITDFKAAYYAFCRSPRKTPIPSRAIDSQLKELGVTYARCSAPSRNGKQARCYRGLSLIDK